MQFTLIGKMNESGFPVDWTKEMVISLVGEVDLDLTKRPPASGARLSVFHLFGRTHINVPSGRRLSTSGLTLLGRREIDVAPANGPDLNIMIYNLFGRVYIIESGTPGSPA